MTDRTPYCGSCGETWDLGHRCPDASSNRVRCQCVGECSGDPNSPECRHITVMVDATRNRVVKYADGTVVDHATNNVLVDGEDATRNRVLPADEWFIALRNALRVTPTGTANYHALSSLLVWMEGLRDE